MIYRVDLHTMFGIDNAQTFLFETDKPQSEVQWIVDEAYGDKFELRTVTEAIT